MSHENSRGQEPSSTSLIYKRKLLTKLLAMQPASLLDVGCGNGELVRSAVAGGCNVAIGLETEQADVEALRARGTEAYRGHGEDLPFPDRSFDLVTLSYVTHHLEDLKQGLAEAARVARRAVLILDCWFDDAFPCQQAARQLDDWLKAIDRRAGLVHNPCPTAAELAAAFEPRGFSISYRQQREPRSLSMMDVEGLIAGGLRRDGSTDNAEAGARLLERAREVGVSDDGALFFTAVRS